MVDLVLVAVVSSGVAHARSNRPYHPLYHSDCYSHARCTRFSWLFRTASQHKGGVTVSCHSKYTVCLTLTGEACCGTGRTSVTPEGWDGDAICSTTAPGGETIGSRMLGGCLATGEMSLGCLITPAARGFIGNTGAG